MKTYVLTDKNEMDAIINACTICFVGVVDGDNCPYVFPMNFGYFDDMLVLHSAPTGKHLDLISKNNKISITFCSEGKIVYQNIDVACSYRMDSKSVICNGEVSFVEDMNQKELLLNKFMSKYSDRSFRYSKPALRNVKLWCVQINHMSARAFGQAHVLK